MTKGRYILKNKGGKMEREVASPVFQGEEGSPKGHRIRVLTISV